MLDPSDGVTCVTGRCIMVIYPQLWLIPNKGISSLIYNKIISRWQYNRKEDVYEAIKTTWSETELDEVKEKKNQSIYYRLLAVIEQKGHYIKT